VYGIDVSSRVEAKPGRKDPVKVQALFDALRPVDRRAA
jgi:phosphoribosylanthranilate isomerase